MTASLLGRNRNFRLVFSASVVSNLGDGVSALAFPWLATLFTRDALLISLVAMAGRLPWFLFSLPAGVWTDRVDRRLLMVRADLMRVVLTLGVVMLILSGPTLPLPDGAGAGPVIALAAVAFLLGSAEVLRDNAAQTILPSVVDKADLERANGQIWSAEQVMGSFVGPPLAGALIALGIAVPFGFDAMTFAMAAGLVWFMVIPPRPMQDRSRFWPALREGAAWIRAHGTILRLAIMLGGINACFMATFTILVLYSQELLGLSAFGHGMLLTAGAAGGVLGGMLSPAIAQRLGARRSLLAALVVFTLCSLMLGLWAAVPVAALCLFAESFASMLWNVVTVSYRQRMIPDEILGRVNSIYRFFGWGMMPLGAVAGGILVTTLEPSLGRMAALHAPYIAAGIGTFAILIYASLRLRL